jgi:hypothetical protein
MKTIIAAVILTVSFGTASAADTCKVFEYAELKDMPRQVLDKKATKYYADSEEWNRLAMGAQTFEASSKWEDRGKVCRHEWERLISESYAKQRQERPFSLKLKEWYCELFDEPPPLLCRK